VLGIVGLQPSPRAVHSCTELQPRIKRVGERQHTSSTSGENFSLGEGLIRRYGKLSLSNCGIYHATKLTRLGKTSSTAALVKYKLLVWQIECRRGYYTNSFLFAITLSFLATVSPAGVDSPFLLRLPVSSYSPTTL
jgi:hypothetical protein